jgi:hypothetical protein
MARKKLIPRKWKYLTGNNPCHVLILKSSTGHYWWITAFVSDKRKRGEIVFSIEYFSTVKECFENFKSLIKLYKAVPGKIPRRRGKNGHR